MDPSGSSRAKQRNLKNPLLLDEKLSYVVPPSAPPAPFYDADHHHYQYPPVPLADGEPILATVLAPSNRTNTTDRTNWTAVTDPGVQAEITRSLSLDPRPQEIPSSGVSGMISRCDEGPPSSSSSAGSTFVHSADRLAALRSVEERLRVREAERQGCRRNALDHASLRAAEAAAAARRRGGGGGKGRGRGGIDEDGLQVDPSLQDGVPSLSEILASRQKKKEGEGGREGGQKHKPGDYQVAEYKIEEGYQISEYRSIYDS
ncbi:hypothetical protein VYU27_005485 [Nannochloropsis oceanica]